MPLAPDLLALAALAVLLAGILRGFTGFGFGLAAAPMLALFLPPLWVVPITLVLQACSSLIGLRASLRDCDPRSTLALSAAAVAATPLGLLALTAFTQQQGRLAIAAVSLAGLLAFAAGWQLSDAGRLRAIVPTGIVAGILGGLCAMPGPPVIAYYLGSGMPPRRCRASMVLIFLATGTAALSVGAATGLFTLRLSLAAAMLLPAMFAGTWLGGWLFERLAGALFRPVALIALAGIAIASATKALV